MSSLPQTFITPEEYLAAERKAPFKSEYANGEVFAMSGTSWEHVQIVRNLSRRLDEQLESGPCQVGTSEMRVRAQRGGPYYYPDVVVVCGEPRFEDNEFDTLLNPKVIFEILSPSTESYDRGKKLEMYREIESLAEYVLIRQDRVGVEHYVLQSGGHWDFSETKDPGGLVELPSIGVRLKVADIYRLVKVEGTT